MKHHALLLIGTAVCALATPAYAQSTQEEVAQNANWPPDTQSNDEIIVTATKRASTVQDVPFSINAQTEEDIQRANAQTLEDISRNVAGLTVQNLGPGQSQVSVRGVSRADRPRPARCQRASRHLSRRDSHIIVAVHARLRSV